MAIFSEADLAALGGMHVTRAWFADVQFPDPIGRRRLHTGLGPVQIGGQTWEGLNDYKGSQVVSLGEIEEPRFGAAPSVVVTLSGANKTFLREVWTTDLEGVACDLYFAIFNGETGDRLIDLKLMFAGKITSPTIETVGLGVRTVALKIISAEEGLNFAATKTAWSPAGQRSRYPRDAGMDSIGSDIVVDFKA